MLLKWCNAVATRKTRSFHTVATGMQTLTTNPLQHNTEQMGFAGGPTQTSDVVTGA